MLEIKLLQVPITNPWTPISIKWTEYKDERTKNDGSVKTEKILRLSRITYFLRSQGDKISGNVSQSGFE